MTRGLNASTPSPSVPMWEPSPQFRIEHLFLLLDWLPHADASRTTAEDARTTGDLLAKVLLLLPPETTRGAMGQICEEL